jgi:hypothetical protein
MGIRKPSNDLVFADESIKNAWEKILKTDKEFAKQLLKAKKDILENAFCGIQIPKDLIPLKYIQKYGINNLWKYNLPDAWRLLYTITTPTKVEIVSVILEWMDHKDYERLFGY